MTYPPAVLWTVALPVPHAPFWMVCVPVNPCIWMLLFLSFIRAPNFANKWVTKLTKEILLLLFVIMWATQVVLDLLHLHGLAWGSVCLAEAGHDGWACPAYLMGPCRTWPMLCWQVTTRGSLSLTEQLALAALWHLFLPPQPPPPINTSYLIEWEGMASSCTKGG